MSDSRDKCESSSYRYPLVSVVISLSFDPSRKGMLFPNGLRVIEVSDPVEHMGFVHALSGDDMIVLARESEVGICDVGTLAEIIAYEYSKDEAKATAVLRAQCLIEKDTEK